MNIGKKHYQHFGQYLKEKRLAAGLSQEAVVIAMGYSDRRFLSRIENGHASLPAQAIPLIADLYKIPLTELVEAVIEEQTRILRQRIENIAYRNVGGSHK